MYFGQKFEPPSGNVIHGAGQSLEQFKNYHECVGNYKPAIYMSYVRINEVGIKLPSKICNAKEISPNLMLQIGLNLKVKSFGSQCKEVSEGVYDEQINELIEMLGNYGNPVFLRIGYEFNNPSNGYSPWYYVSAWKHIVTMFRKSKVDNVAFVWNCCTAFTRNIQEIMEFYPGDEYVDWFADNLFGVRHFTETENPKIVTEDFVRESVNHRKPLMIGESSPAEIGVDKGVQSWRDWFEPYFRWISKHPVIKAFCYINWDWGKDWKKPDWLNGRIEDNEEVRERYLKEISKLKYIHLGSDWNH
ncbi:MAG: hypothetical protein ABEJ02_04530 [Candidatus Paceibacteria bacterium]